MATRSVGEGVPVGVEAPGDGIEEVETGEVRLVVGCGVDVGVEGAGELVGGEQVHAAVAHEGGPGGDRVQGPLQTAVRGPLPGGPASTAGEDVGAVGGLGQVQEVRALGVVQLERAGDGFEDGGGDAGEVAAFEFGVVLDADVGQGCDLAPAQPRHTAPRPGGQPGPFRGDLHSPRGEELADLCTVVHSSTVRAARRERGVLAVHPLLVTRCPPGKPVTWMTWHSRPRRYGGARRVCPSGTRADDSGVVSCAR